jgi:CubicO group peptidase (beta-lactamase class C family)
MKHFLIAILLFAFFNTSAQYNPPYFEDSARVQAIRATQSVVDKIFRDHAEANHFPGFAYGIISGGRLVYSGTIGYTDIGKQIPVGSSSAFRIASMSKSFTAMAILQLRDKGKLRLDDPASMYIPEMKKLKYLTADAPPITIRNLLTHSAGFPEDNPWGDRQLDDTDKELMELISGGVTFSNVPNVSYEYSNLGFALLGRIITNVSKVQYQKYITDNIFKPLGMNNTWWEYAKVPANKLAHGYRWINGNWREEELLHDGSYGAMGGIISSVDDFAKYVALHMSAWPARDGKESPVLKRSSLREMHTLGIFSGFNPNYKFPKTGKPCAITSIYTYGLGVTKDCEGRTWVGHSGGLPGFGSQWRMFAEHDLAVVSFANLTYAGTGGVNLAVLDTIVRLARLKPRVIPPSNILEKRKDDLLQLLPHWNDAEKSGIFAENFFADNIIDSLKKQSMELFSKAGRDLKIGRMEPENNLRASFLLEGERANIRVFFTLSPENPALIQEFRIFEVRR